MFFEFFIYYFNVRRVFFILKFDVKVLHGFGVRIW